MFQPSFLPFPSCLAKSSFLGDSRAVPLGIVTYAAFSFHFLARLFRTSPSQNLWARRRTLFLESGREVYPSFFLLSLADEVSNVEEGPRLLTHVPLLLICYRPFLGGQNFPTRPFLEPVLLALSVLLPGSPKTLPADARLISSPPTLIFCPLRAGLLLCCSKRDPRFDGKRARPVAFPPPGLFFNFFSLGTASS